MFVVGARGRNVFTRSQQGEKISRSYEELPVHCKSMRNEGNFKGLLSQCKGQVRKIPNITKFRAFRIERVDGQVDVRVKEFMHSPQWAGFTARSAPLVGAPPFQVFPGRVPRLQEDLPFELKQLDPDFIRNIERRYKACQPRLDTRFFDGEKTTFSM